MGGPLCEDAHEVLRDLGRRLSAFSGDVREVQFLYQRISVVQRFNAVLLHDSFLLTSSPAGVVSIPFSTFFSFFPSKSLVIYLPWV